MPGDTGGVGGAIRSAVPGVSGPWSSPLFGCFDDIGICEYSSRFLVTLLDTGGWIGLQFSLDQFCSKTATPFLSDQILLAFLCILVSF